jgi:hypothetical protein
MINTIHWKQFQKGGFNVEEQTHAQILIIFVNCQNEGDRSLHNNHSLIIFILAKKLTVPTRPVASVIQTGF